MVVGWGEVVFVVGGNWPEVDDHEGRGEVVWSGCVERCWWWSWTAEQVRSAGLGAAVKRVVCQDLRV